MQVTEEKKDNAEINFKLKIIPSLPPTPLQSTKFFPWD